MISTGQFGLRQVHPSSAALILPDILRLIVKKSNTSAISRGMISTGQFGLRQVHPSSAALILPDILTHNSGYRFPKLHFTMVLNHIGLQPFWTRSFSDILDRSSQGRSKLKTYNKYISSLLSINSLRILKDFKINYNTNLA